MIRVVVELESLSSPPGERLAEVTASIGKWLAQYDGRDVVAHRVAVEEVDE